MSAEQKQSSATAAISTSSTVPSASAPITLDAAAFESRFVREKHKEFVLSLDKKTDTFEYFVGEHLRMSGVYCQSYSIA